MHNEKTTEPKPCAEEQIKSIYSQLAWIGDALLNLKTRLEPVLIPDDVIAEAPKLERPSAMPSLNESLNNISSSLQQKAKAIEDMTARITL
jgi:hypothetical protein